MWEGWAEKLRKGDSSGVGAWNVGDGERDSGEGDPGKELGGEVEGREGFEALRASQFGKDWIRRRFLELLMERELGRKLQLKIDNEAQGRRVFERIERGQKEAL